MPKKIQEKLIEISEESKDIVQLNEMLFKVQNSLPKNIENSVFYPKLKQLLHMEIVRFAKDQIELKQDLNFLRMNVGEAIPEAEIREYLDSLKEKYNGQQQDIAIDYHVEVTRIDYGVPVFVVIRRGTVHMKKFVFRFRKSDIRQGLDGLSQQGVPLAESLEERRQRYLKLMGDSE
jgi:hypothetical protein